MGRVSEALRLCGAVNESTKLTARELCERLGISTSCLGVLIENERRDGFPVCASFKNHGGYFLANPLAVDGESAIRECAASLRARSEMMQKTAETLLESINGGG